MVQGKKLKSLIRKLLELAEEGDMVAMKEVFDRSEGKVAQVHATDDEQPFIINIKR